MRLPALVLLVWAAPPQPLAIVQPQFHQFEDGPSVPASSAYLSGETVFFSFQVAGFKPEGEDQVVQLSYNLSVRDADNVALVEPKSGKLRAELAPQDKDWKPKIRWDFVVPPWALSGTYRLSAVVRDLNSGQEISRDFPFLVRGPAITPADKLGVQNFRFLRSEDDSEPLSPPAYRPGSAVWARFDITGFKLGEKNRLHLEYDIAVLSPAGKQIYSQANAAVEKDESFYPKRFVPAAFSLSLTPTVKPGPYTVVLSLRDGIGAQIAESRHVFTVE